MLRRGVACLLLLAGPAVAAAQDVLARSLDDCTDHVCFCTVSARGAAPAAGQGHCPGHAATGARMAPWCRHGEDSEPRLAAVTPFLLPEGPPRDAPLLPVSPAAVSPVARASAGFARTDLPPPRSF